jgi:hypothetical protein
MSLARHGEFEELPGKLSLKWSYEGRFGFTNAEIISLYDVSGCKSLAHQRGTEDTRAGVKASRGPLPGGEPF